MWLARGWNPSVELRRSSFAGWFGGEIPGTVAAMFLLLSVNPLFEAMWRIPATFRTPLRLCARQQTDGPETRGGWQYKLSKIVFNLSGYNKYGLYTDDMKDTHEFVVQEALRRLPIEVLDARNFRLIRAIQLDFLKTFLPREKWITFEQDLEYRYLKPYLDEVLAERNEIYKFGCSNYRWRDWPYGEVK